MNLPTVYINGRFVSQRVTGVQRYAWENLFALDEQLASQPSPPFRAVLLLPAGCEKPPLRAIGAREVGGLKGHLWEQLVLPRATRGGLLFSFAPTGPMVKREQIITIHDVAVWAAPEGFGRAFRSWYRVLLGRLAPRLPAVMTVSEFSRKEIVRWLHCEPEKVHVATEGWQHLHRTASDESVLSRHGLQGKRFVLGVSSVAPNKNFRLIVEAAQKLGSPDFEIVIAGGLDAKVFGGTGLPSLPFVKMLGYVSDAELRALYENAAVFVHPSLYEGFGIPPIEAMASGCPVVASNAASLPEVCGAAACYVSPDDPQALADVLRELMADDEKRQEMAARGRAHVARFSWEESARINASVIGQVLGASPRPRDSSASSSDRKTPVAAAQVGGE